jgi:excisionase family DNA binding protein
VAKVARLHLEPERDAPITRHTPLADLPEFLRCEEAAAFLGVSKGIVYELARRGELPSVRFGRLLRIKREGLR